MHRREPHLSPPRQGYGALALVLTVGLFFFSGYQGLTVLTPHFVASLDYTAVLVGASTTVFVATASISNLVLGFVPHGRDIRRGCIAAALLLGIPCFALPFRHDAITILFLTALRGIGLGFAGVLLGTAAAVVAPPGRRGLAIGLFGVTGSGLAAFAQAGCLFLASHYGFTTAFVTMGIVTLLGIAPVLALGELPLLEGRTFLASADDALQWDVLLPSLMWFFVMVTYGALLSFGPQRLEFVGSGVAVDYFLVVAGATAISRLVMGVLVDRFKPLWALAAALVAAAVALSLLGSRVSSAVLIVSAALYGLSLGTVSTGGLLTVLARIHVTKFNLGNGLFNFAGVAGMGVGGIVFGVVVDVTDTRTMFLLTPLVLCFSAAVLIADRVRIRRGEVLAVAAVTTTDAYS